jgi:hypothetical protein
VQYAQKLSRGLIFVKWLLAAPHYPAPPIRVWSVAACLFGNRVLLDPVYRALPARPVRFVGGTARWGAHVGAYVGLMRDEYPPFSWTPGAYPLTYEVDYPERLSRWLIFVKWLLLVPHYVVLIFLWVAAIVAYIIAWFAILFTEQFPQGLFVFLVGVDR